MFRMFTGIPSANTTTSGSGRLSGHPMAGFLPWVVMAALAAAAGGGCGPTPNGGGDDDTEGDGGNPPQCLPEEEASGPPPGDTAGGDDPAEVWLGVTQFLTSCENLFGVGQGCAQPATGTVRLGEETWTIAWGCAGPVLVEDGWQVGETVIEAILSGFHLSLTSADGCSPELNIVVLLTPEESGLESLNIPLADPLCPEGADFTDAMHRVAVTLGTESACYQPPASPTGSLEITEVPGDESNGAAGKLVGTVVDETGASVELEVDFEIQRTITLMGLQILTNSMCRAR